MNIGIVPTMSPIGNSQNQKLGQAMAKSEGFKSTFASLLQPQGGNALSNEGEVNINIAEVLKDILKLLTDGTLTDVNELKILDTSKVTKEQISDLLGMNEKDWKDQLSTLMDELFALLGNNPQYAQQLFTVKKSMNEENYLQGTNELLTIISKLPNDIIQKINPEQFQFLAKTAKTVETLGKMIDLSKADIKNLSELKDSVQGLISKVEQLVKSNSIESRNAILQNTFHNMLIKQKEQSNVSPIVNEVENIDQNTNVQNNLPQLSKVEQFVLHIGKDAKGVNYQQFVKDFSNILAKAHFTQGDGTNKLLIKLYPEHLGSLRIEVLQDKGILTAKMFATTGAAKEILESQMHQLKNAFTQQSIQIDKIDVIYGQPEAQKFDRGGQQQQQQAFRQQQEIPEQESDEDANVQFSDVLHQSLIEEKI